MWQRRHEGIRVSGSAVITRTDIEPQGNVPTTALLAHPAVDPAVALLVRLERTVNIGLLRGHEETRQDYLAKLSDEIEKDGFLRRPIAADVRTWVILDGHHRVNALNALGCWKIPVYFVDYLSPQIVVIPWREGEKVTKEMVINAGLRGPKLPPKTTRHMVRTSNSFSHITAIETELNVPLDELRPAKLP